MSDKSIYIYGFININEEQIFDYVGIEGGEVYTQPYQDIAAVVSDSPFTQFDALPKETLFLPSGRLSGRYRKDYEKSLYHPDEIWDRSTGRRGSQEDPEEGL